MKYIGITRQVDKLGRIVIPSDFRKNLGIETLDILDVSLIAETIVIRKRNLPCCIFCSNEADLIEIDGKYLCTPCIKRLKKRLKNLFN